MTNLNEIQNIAKARGGKCLSQTFEGWKYKLKWECSEGHIWDATLSNVKYGKWCPICGKKKRGILRRDTIENMHILANKKKGSCLSPEYHGNNIHLKWKCKEGHIWKATPGNVKQGKWCPTCSYKKSAQRRKNTIGDMQKIAESKNGKCLSNIYINMNTSLQWQCNNGHIWDALPSNIANGKWCPYCIGKYRKIDDMKELARKKNGKCLSAKFKGMNQKLLWQCEKEHTWETTPSSILNSDTWCPLCSNNLKKDLNYCKDLALQRGGKCLSKYYKNIDEKILWECAYGHHFKLSTYSVSKSRWCPICNEKIRNLNEEKCRFIFQQIFNQPFYKNRKILKGKLELDGYNEILKIAFEYNGVQHYEFNKYFHKSMNAFEKQKERDRKKQLYCKQQEITLIIIPYTIETDQQKFDFITDNLKKKEIQIDVHGIDLQWQKFYEGYAPFQELIQIADKKGGECLSIGYHGIDNKLVWRCERGHIWESSPYQIKKGSWCPKCIGRNRTIEDMQLLAKRKDGHCLSSKYINNTTKLKWQCKEGHQWEMTPASVNKGAWCPACSGKRTYTIEDMQKIAQGRKGECLSKTYINVATKMKWRCEKGHIWEARASSVIRGSWCKTCLKYSLEDCIEIAKRYNGKCLSTKYVDINTKLEWCCKYNHKWKATLDHIKKGFWCSTCKIEENKDKNNKKLLALQEIAKNHNGKCLGTSYKNVDTKMLWECAQGHQWEATPYKIKNGSWCRKCAAKKNAAKLKLTLEDMQQLAQEKNGKCLSKLYINSSSLLEWECDKEHRWFSTPNSIRQGSWCRECSTKKNAAKKRKTIEDMQVLAAKRNGTCLSKEYVNAHTKLVWKCSRSHIWQAKPNNIQQGKWCPECRGK